MLLQLAGFCLLTAGVIYALRAAVYALIQNSPASNSNAGGYLAPAEAAFLLRNGDMGHTMIVIAADLLQRAAKETTDIKLHPYEREVWTSVRQFTTNWAHEKAGHIIPVQDIKSPIQWLIRLNTIKAFFGGTFRNIVHDVLKDPRNIRKYFSMTGVLRLAFQMYTSSSKSAVEANLKQELFDKNLLVSPRRRQFGVAGLLVLILLAVAAIFGIERFLPHLPQLAAHPFYFFLLPLFNAGLLRVIFELPNFLPSFEEFAKVANEIQRSGFRLGIVRAVLRFARTLLGVALALVVAFLLGLAVTIAFALKIPIALAVTAIIGFSVIALCIVQLIIDAYTLSFNELASHTGEAKLKQLRERLSKTGPLEVLKQTLANPNYDPTLSELVALYGVETLWLLS